MSNLKLRSAAALLAFVLAVPGAGQAANLLVLNANGTNGTATTAMTTALTTLGHTYTVVTAAPGTFAGYDAVLIAGIPTTADRPRLTAYLDAGGKMMVADNDLGYSLGTNAFYTTYLQATYSADAGSLGPIVGAGIMVGTDVNISSDPYPDSFTATGPESTCIFTNTAPRTGCAGLAIERTSGTVPYRAIYLAWDFQYTNGTADTTTKVGVLGKVTLYLTGQLPVGLQRFSVE